MVDWMDEENNKAQELANSEKTNNSEAPRLKKEKSEPTRAQKHFYLQSCYRKAFEQLVFDESRKDDKGLRAPALAEKALDHLFKEYGINVDDHR